MPINNQKTEREISAGVIVYRDTKEGLKFLLLYHGKGYWNFPKGHLDKGEKNIQAAFRELEEETGITKKNLILEERFKTNEKFFFVKNKNQKVFKIVTLFLALSKTEKVMISHEHEGYGWFLYKDAVKLLKYKESRSVLEKANNFLKTKT